MTQTDLPSGLSTRDCSIVLAYRDTSRSVDEVQAAFGLTRDALYAVLRRAREPFRRPASAKPRRVARQSIGIATSRLMGLSGPTPGGEHPSVEPLRRRLERMLVSQLVDLDDRRGAGAIIDPERAARVLASSVRALLALNRVDLADAADDTDADPTDPPVRSLAELRDELGRHLERIRLEERARRGLDPDGPEPG